MSTASESVENLRARMQALSVRLRSATFAERKPLLVEQLELAHRLSIAGGIGPTAGLGSWSILLELTRASPESAHPELLTLVERAGTVNGKLSSLCLSRMARLLSAAEAKARLESALEQATDWDDIGNLAAAMPPKERESILERKLEEALALASDQERWAACDSLTFALEDEAEVERWERWFGQASIQRFGRISDDPYRLWGDGPTPEQLELRREQERAHWGATFDAWRLGSDAVELPESEQGPAFDLAVDAFEKLIHTPIDPGNDEGPFWAIARYLSLAQTRRALSILGRMKAEDWCYELAGSKSALATRLAWLGQTHEALGVLDSIGHEGEFDPHWRSTAWGGILSGRLMNEPELTLAQALHEAEATGDSIFLDSQGRFRMLSELHHQFGTHALPARAAEIAEACLSEVVALTRRDTKQGRIALEEAIGVWARSLPQERWFELIEARTSASDRIELWEALLESEREGTRPTTPVLARLLRELETTRAPYPANMLELLWSERDSLRPEDLLLAWSGWLESSTEPRGGFVGSIRERSTILGSVLVFLAGPETPGDACRALAHASSEHDTKSRD